MIIAFKILNASNATKTQRSNLAFILVKIKDFG